MNQLAPHHIVINITDFPTGLSEFFLWIAIVETIIFLGYTVFTNGNRNTLIGKSLLLLVSIAVSYFINESLSAEPIKEFCSQSWANLVLTSVGFAIVFAGLTVAYFFILRAKNLKFDLLIIFSLTFVLTVLFELSFFLDTFFSYIALAIFAGINIVVAMHLIFMPAKRGDRDVETLIDTVPQIHNTEERHIVTEEHIATEI